MSTPDKHMPNNPHFQCADASMAYFASQESTGYHQTQATLALAFEQRTANLLELLKYTGAPEFKPLMQTIEARLGL